jgi:hypothetical protein
MTQEAMNRRKMVAIMENYTEALIEKNPQALPLAAGCRATYNGKECQIGENPLWKNTLIIKQRQTFIDPVSGEMVFFGVMSNEPREMNETFPVNIHVYSKQYLATIRLKIVDGKITEIEELTIDKRLRYFYADSEEVRLPDLEFEISVPEEERCTREELVEMVEAYWDCAEKRQPADVLKVHPDAQRYENGYRTTNHSNSFRGDFKHNKSFRWDVPDNSRLYPVVDPVRGLVVSSCFMVNGANASQDGLEGARIVEAFKIKDGAICHLLAFFPVLGGETGWEKD